MTQIQIDKLSTAAPQKLNKEKTKIKTAAILDELQKLFKELEKKGKSVLVVLQGMDTSGKDSVCRRVFERMNLKNLSIVNFKEPTEEEIKQDFLWRVHPHAPATGSVSVFNRSYYEDILVPEVHGTFSKKIVENRYNHINAFEELLADHGTIIFKFYLNISHESQHKRIQERISDPEKHYKYNIKDVEESKKWNQYMRAYQKIFQMCSVVEKWEIIPSDQKWYRDYSICRSILNRMLDK